MRGVANAELTPELAFKLGCYGGYVPLQQAEGNAHPRVLVGVHRISGQLLGSRFNCWITLCWD